MQVLYQRCAAVDVGKDVIAIAVRRPGDGPDGRQIIKRTFKTFFGVLAEAARWLSGLGVTHVAMEATGIYSMPACHALTGHGDFTQVLVCNAGHVKNVPGRKTDLADADWLVHLLECGLLAGSFIPPADIKAARDVIRYRTKIVQSRTSEVQRLGNVLQDAQLTELRGRIAVSGGSARGRAATPPPQVQVSITRAIESATIGGAAATDSTGVASTRRGAPAWSPLQEIDPTGSWRISLDASADPMFASGQLNDLLFIISWHGRAPAWPA